MTGRHLVAALAFGLCALTASTTDASAQEHARQRKLFAVGAHGGFLGAGGSAFTSEPSLYGPGGRLTVHLAPLTDGPVDPLDYFSFGGFYWQFPQQPPYPYNENGVPLAGALLGAEVDVHLVRVPVFGLLDPFFAVGFGALILSPEGRPRTTTNVIMPGVGFRVPLSRRVEVRFGGQYVSMRASGGTAPPTADWVFLDGGLQLAF